MKQFDWWPTWVPVDVLFGLLTLLIRAITENENIILIFYLFIILDSLP